MNLTMKRPAVYSTLYEFPHGRPYDLYYAEKVPLLQVFERAVFNWKSRRSYHGWRKLAYLTKPSSPMQAAECGVFRGHSLVACLKIARDLNTPVHFFGLDSFQGLPPLSEEDLKAAPSDAPYREKLLFSETSLADVRKRVMEAGFNRQVQFLPGFFSDTLKTLPEKRYDFVNIDCDLYDPHMECLEYFYPRLNKGGLLFFDDYHSNQFPMAGLAIDRFLKDKPEKLFHLRFGPNVANHTKCYLEKI